MSIDMMARFAANYIAYCISYKQVGLVKYEITNLEDVRDLERAHHIARAQANAMKRAVALASDAQPRKRRRTKGPPAPKRAKPDKVDEHVDAVAEDEDDEKSDRTSSSGDASILGDVESDVPGPDPDGPGDGDDGGDDPGDDPGDDRDDGLPYFNAADGRVYTEPGGRYLGRITHIKEDTPNHKNTTVNKTSNINRSQYFIMKSNGNNNKYSNK